MTRPLSYHDLQNYEQPRETKQEFDLREIRLKANQEIMELRKARERYVPHAATQKQQNDIGDETTEQFKKPKTPSYRTRART